jgi:hypothetical protein
MKYKDPMEQYHRQGNDAAKHYAFVDFLLVTPDVTDEEIFEHTGIRLSDFDFDDDGEEYPTTPDEFRDDIIQQAFKDDKGYQQEYFVNDIRKGYPLTHSGEGWTFTELYQLHRLLKKVFEPVSGVDYMVALAKENLELFTKPQPT